MDMTTSGAEVQGTKQQNKQQPNWVLSKAHEAPPTTTLHFGATVQSLEFVPRHNTGVVSQ